MTKMDDRDIAVNNPLTITLIQTDSAFNALKGAWDNLIATSNSSNVCQQFDWCSLWWETYRSTSNKLYILTIYAKEKLVGIVPFFISNDECVFSLVNSTLRLLGQDASTRKAAYAEGQDILAAKGYEQLLINKVSQFLAKKNQHWHRYLFRGLSKDSLLTQVSQQLSSKLLVSKVEKGAQLVVTIPNNSYDNFVSRQTREWRSLFRGYLRLLETTGDYTLQCADTVERIMPALHSMAQIHCSQQRKIESGKCHFDSALYMKFYEQVCDTFSRRKEVVIMSLLLETRLLASCCLFEKNNTLYCHQLSSVRGEGVRFSPQLILMMWAIRSAAAKGLSNVVFQSEIRLSETLQNITDAEYKKTYAIEAFASKRKALMVAASRKFTQLLKAVNIHP